MSENGDIPSSIRITIEDALQLIGTFAAVISPGIFVIYNYDNSLIHTADNVKLILVATTYSLPVFIASLALNVWLSNYGNEKMDFFPSRPILYKTIYLSTTFSYGVIAMAISCHIVLQEFIPTFFGALVILFVGQFLVEMCLIKYKSISRDRS